MHPKPGQRSCIQKSVLSEKDKAAVATRSKEKNDWHKEYRMRAACAQTHPQARGSRYLMIGEGTHSTNQGRHAYVRDNVEVC
jgi:hypothetical protein